MMGENRRQTTDDRRQYVLRWSIVVVLIETVSALTIFNPFWNNVATVIVVAVVAYLSWKRTTIAMGALLLELLIGSKGYLFQFGAWPDTISLRMLLTAVFFCGWLVNALQHHVFPQIVRQIRMRRAYLALFILIGFATLRGYFLGNGEVVIKDGNAWVDWLLLFPVLDISWRYRDRVRRDIVPVLFVGIFWLAIKTIGLEYIFSHGFKLLSQPTYLWVRRTGVGEVTLVVANAFRIFMQSYVYAIPGLLLGCAWWITERRSKIEYRRLHIEIRTLIFLSSCALILAISLSRSFWIGTFVGMCALLAMLTWARVKWWKRFLGPIGAGVTALLVVAAVLAFPVPRVEYASLKSLFGARTDVGEAAAVSRWNLLPVLGRKIREHPILGSGFGATVTYQTRDPRILKDHPDGMYTTYAFEWGWLEHWIKFGILGIPLIAYLLWSLGRRIWRMEEPLWMRAGSVASLVAIAATHVFTPYLNHPLGFVFFFVGEGLLLSSRRSTPEQNPGRSSEPSLPVGP